MWLSCDVGLRPTQEVSTKRSRIRCLSYEQELVEDMLSLMSSFSAKIYGKRSSEVRKAKKLAEAAAAEE